MILRSLVREARGIIAMVLGVAVVGFDMGAVQGQTFSSGSTGADGTFAPTCAPKPCTVELQLPESGVFNFTTITIHAGVIVKIVKNSRNTPVTILASGDVVIEGSIDVSGKDGVFRAMGPPGEGGPGGFDGGPGGLAATFLLPSLDGSPGLGPGGGDGGAGGAGSARAPQGGGGADHLFGPRAYGVHTLSSLVGGSGGGGGGANDVLDGGGGGGGGGAILIASSGTMTLGSQANGCSAGVPGTCPVIATGGDGGGSCVTGQVASGGGGGSGGAVRLVANRIVSPGGAYPAWVNGGSSECAGVGSVQRGRIRVEAYQLDPVLGLLPAGYVSRGYPGPVPPPTGFPSIRIVKVGGVAAPDILRGTFLESPDIVLDPNLPNPITVAIAASNVPVGTLVQLVVASEGMPIKTIVGSTPLAGTLTASTASLQVTLPKGTSVLEVTATASTPLASNGRPMTIGGEEVKWMRVGANFGGSPTVVYVTSSGREIPVR